jgi:hypothetical protein
MWVRLVCGEYEPDNVIGRQAPNERGGEGRLESDLLCWTRPPDAVQ